MSHGNAVVLALCSITILFQISPATAPRPWPQIPAIFAFGDSTVDPGNNNNIATLLRADHLPYGRNLPGHAASGRFSDGKLTTDYISSVVGLNDLLPAYLDSSLTNIDLLGGASFGSAGTGLDELTANLSKVLDMESQLNYFEEAMVRIKKMVGERKGEEMVKKGLFVISVGTNDLLYNVYLLPTRMLQFSVSGYHDFLLQKLRSLLQRLYKKGARKMVVVGVPPIGCLPLQVTMGSLIPSDHMTQRLCNKKQNDDCQAYNNKLKALSIKLQATLVGAKVAYLDVYGPIMDMVANPSKYGFEETSKGCCGSGLMEMGPMCNFLSPTCYDASKFIFWDAVHLTQAAYSILANHSTTTLLPHFAL
ncbi:unnamed protein product [Citrullus colocynthis]|uniref:GDSL esterase/lipase n=1 Tax=Citrullus colocynthis TaxID=252529 RepID=A0ABP0Y5L7_9ROSI